jgi:hypothetical protein
VKFFNIDLHISVIADINSIFEQLGHSIDINYLSNHAWVFNKTPNNLFNINQSNWSFINEEMCDNFFNENKEKLNIYDGFIVTHIPALSLLYEKFNKPIIFVASTRYEYPFTKDIKRWEWFNNYINNNKNIILIANNLYDKWYCEQFINKNFRYIPSLCDYTNSKYTGNKDKNILSSRLLNLNHETIINKNVLGKYSWDELSDYKSIIHIPYNVSTMTIFENYTSNIPMFFPSKKLNLELAKKKLTLTELSYNQVLGLENKSFFKYNGDIDPNDYNSNLLLDKSIDLSDFYNDNMKEVILFDDFNDLGLLLYNTDFKKISEKMRIHNIDRKDFIFQNWKKILEDI